jgi:integrase/recombinase XerD
MLEGGADIRFIQAMLGHASLEATQVYTRVAIRKLKEVHELSHPGANPRQRPEEAAQGRDAAEEELLSALAAEAAEDDEDRADQENDDRS